MAIRTLLAGLALAAGLSAPFALAAPGRAGDAAQGGVLAKRWCASCHVVANDQTSASADAPAFTEIARRHVDRKKLAQFLAAPHPPMPDMNLARKEIDDLVAYIKSQGHPDNQE